MIRDEEEMRALMMFLTLKLNTYNGCINSIDRLKERRVISKHLKPKDMLLSIMKTYTLMKVRMKLSYEAATKR